ncbi:MAG TPA: hypothetical protein VMU94_30415 [Streptosporangiaceae bacterium]|nr:hypothetical protein [Streptosporangiaceae bacterium]
MLDGVSVVKHDKQRASSGQLFEVAGHGLLPDGQESDVDFRSRRVRRYLPQHLGLTEAAAPEKHRDLAPGGIADPADDLVNQLSPAHQRLPVI